MNANNGIKRLTNFGKMQKSCSRHIRSQNETENAWMVCIRSASAQEEDMAEMTKR
jgi:hypothetical protein